MAHPESKSTKKIPASNARDSALTETAWKTVGEAQVLIRGYDEETGIRAIVHIAGRASWIHSHEETTDRLQRMFPGLPPEEQRLILRHISARINARAIDQGFPNPRRKRWATSWMSDERSDNLFNL